MVRAPDEWERAILAQMQRRAARAEAAEQEKWTGT
jgi:hypothetical protein